MSMTSMVLTSQAVLFSREILYFSRNMLRCYHHHGKLCQANNFLLGKYLWSFNHDPWVVQRTRYSTDKTTESLSGTLTKTQAKELACKLTAEERDLFMSALQECESEENKSHIQRRLAAFRWSSKLGRPSKISSLGDVDPTGTYCHVPDDWLMRKYGRDPLHDETSTESHSVEKVPEPAKKVLLLVAMGTMIPFIGFGFFDNFIMIVAGDQIEMLLNKKIPISTITAAALGNTVSDAISIGSVYYIELLAKKVGFEPPKLTTAQLNLPKARAASSLGRVIGITIGCLLGMMPIPIFAYLHNGG